MRPTFYCLIAVALMSAAPALAHADNITTFYLNGVTLQTGAAYGSVTIDTTTGIVTAADVDVSNGTSSFRFNITDGTGPNAADTYFDLLDSAGDIFQLSVPNLTLVDYSGSRICTFGNRCNGYVGGFFPGAIINGPGSDYNATGSLSATPEPSSIALLGTGILGLTAAARRRLRAA